MNSRERTFLALNREEPDRVPIDFWASDGLRQKLGATQSASFEAFLTAHDVDLRYIEGPRYIGPPLWHSADGADEDIWGVRRQMVQVSTPGGVESYKEIALSPLASATTVEEIENYTHWPSPDWFDYSSIEAQCEAIRKQERVVVFMGDRLNRVAQLKPAMYLRGIAQILQDMALCPDLARAILGRIRRFYGQYAARIFEAAHGKLDIVLTGDDFGSQNGPLLSPRMWNEFLGQGFADYAQLAHSYGLRVMHHTCGAVRPLIPLMLERGLDILQALQPEAAGMDGRALKKEFGNCLAFHGGVSIQRTLPFGSPAEVRREVRERVEALAAGGGYILCTSHNIQADTPIENVQHLLQAYHDYGRYAGTNVSLDERPSHARIGSEDRCPC
jgi:uroporphyrinogen decarboxylase